MYPLAICTTRRDSTEVSRDEVRQVDTPPAQRTREQAAFDVLVRCVRAGDGSPDAVMANRERLVRKASNLAEAVDEGAFGAVGRAAAQIQFNIATITGEVTQARKSSAYRFNVLVGSIVSVAAGLAGGTIATSAATAHHASMSWRIGIGALSGTSIGAAGELATMVVARLLAWHHKAKRLRQLADALPETPARTIRIVHLRSRSQPPLDLLTGDDSLYRSPVMARSRSVPMASR